jgi:plastocyanin
MRSLRLLSMIVALAALLAHGTTVHGQAGGGTIVGHIKYAGPSPVNPVIRMGADPRCNRLYAGKRPTSPLLVVGADGGMANAFVSLDGNFPGTPAPTTPVVINQQDCMYAPRVVGARVGQTLQLKNNDETTHNLHALSMAGNDFNTSQPTKGMVFEYTLKAGEILHIKCDIHGWMNSYVGIVDHPYFAVSGADGSFTIPNVPPGKYTVRVWHETLGAMMQTIEVQAGKTSTLDVSYGPGQKTAALTDVSIREFIAPTASTPVRVVLR